MYCHMWSYLLLVKTVTFSYNYNLKYYHSTRCACILHRTLGFRAFRPTHHDCSKPNSFPFFFSNCWKFFWFLAVAFLGVHIGLEISLANCFIIFSQDGSFFRSMMIVFAERNRTSANAAPGRRSGTAPVSLNLSHSTCHEYWSHCFL